MLVWVTLLALLLQSFFVETHLHQPAGQASIHRDAGTAVAAERPAPANHSLCPLCAEMALSGHYIAPGAITFAAPVALDFWLYRPVALAIARRQAAHHWQSRAPPPDPQI